VARGTGQIFGEGAMCIRPKPNRQPTKAADTLAGKYFLTFYKGRPDYRGVIRGSVKGNRYLIQYLGWRSGGWGAGHIVALKEMLDWHFYDTAEQMRSACQ
jgi:hypothetical protein